MKCQKCGHATAVVETRLEDSGVFVRRRRQCAVCAHRFNTYEISDTLANTIKKYASAHVIGTLKRWALAARDKEIVRRVLNGEKRYMLAEEFHVKANTITAVTRKAGLPSHSRGKPRSRPASAQLHS